MKFRYRKDISRNARTGEVSEYFHPMLPCRIQYGDRCTPDMEGLLDTGADGIILPMSIARYLDLKMDRTVARRGVGGPLKAYRSSATILLGRGEQSHPPIKNVEVFIPIGLAERHEPPIILGRKPIFELFRITFVEAERYFEMVPWTLGK